jgi:hypothetical protein
MMARMWHGVPPVSEVSDSSRRPPAAARAGPCGQLYRGGQDPVFLARARRHWPGPGGRQPETVRVADRCNLKRHGSGELTKYRPGPGLGSGPAGRPGCRGWPGPRAGPGRPVRPRTKARRLNAELLDVLRINGEF